MQSKSTYMYVLKTKALYRLVNISLYIFFKVIWNSKKRNFFVYKQLTVSTDHVIALLFNVSSHPVPLSWTYVASLYHVVILQGMNEYITDFYILHKPPGSRLWWHHCQQQWWAILDVWIAASHGTRWFNGLDGRTALTNGKPSRWFLFIWHYVLRSGRMNNKRYIMFYHACSSEGTSPRRLMPRTE